MRQLNSMHDFERAIQKGTCLIDFNAPWCAPCISQKTIIERLENHYKNKVLIAEMNVDLHQDVAVTLGIQNIPTLIVFQDKKEIRRLIGIQPESTLENILKRLVASE